MTFKDRIDAGRQLAARLSSYANRDDIVVLGIPRGGVTVASEVAQALHAPLDIFLSRKLGVPGHEELAFGAIAAGDGRYLDRQVIEATGISNQQIERVTQDVKNTLQQRALLYRGNRPPVDVTGKTIILVDDGIATGASVYAAISALRQMKPSKLVLAVPVAPASTCAWLRPEVDQLICVYAPDQFYAVGQFYGSFPQVEDVEVQDLLQSAAYKKSSSDHSGNEGQSDVTIDLIDVRLEGTLSIPNNPKGIVLFAHGSGSSRHSVRNRYVAQVLQSEGFATLLFDLLTSEEEAVDSQTAELRFDIALLAKRLVGVTQWITRHPATRNLAIGYFGASTGAAAALVAASRLPGLVTAIVSRGGRPDLAGEALITVRASVLLIVGGKDEMVIGLNRQAHNRLQCPNKELVIVPGATHLFEEAGALEKVAQLAADWFVHNLVSDRSTLGSSFAPVPKAR
ncbi:phosphoribosyltransferase family protein [Edaphobacter paludis]|uniref:Phosphoribosyltransferase family protein n=1 Tax=Edaphobacter paludis TaxID=3035702 RepID=A0AAU7CUG9_9BACT